MSAHPSPTPMAPSSDDILAALDPEQRVVAAAPSGPVCVLAGAGTGKTRAITHRIAYGVHSGAYQPQRVLAVTFTARAAGEMRTRLRDARRSAGCRPAPSTPRRCASCTTSGRRRSAARAPRVAAAQGRGWSPRPARGCGCQLDRTTVRDLVRRGRVGQGQHADARDLPRRGPPRRTRRRPGWTPPPWRGCSRPTRRSRPSAGVIDFEDVLLLTGRHPQRARGHRRAPSAASTATSWSTSTRTSTPLQQRLLDLWLGERDDALRRRRRRQTIYSFTGASPRHLLEFPPATRRPRW